MGIYIDKLGAEVRLERMRPNQIEQARSRRAAIYVAFGAVEWHGHHNPVGLDCLKAHEQLVGLATRCGGVVYPPVYFGAGGGHTEWPHSYMVSADPMVQIVAELLHGFQRDGYTQAILLSGHYPNRSQYLDGGLARYRQQGGAMAVLALVENQVPGVTGDHAAKYETSAMLYLDPETVDQGRLYAEMGDPGGPEQIVNWMGDDFREHPCYGLVGIDPRPYASAQVGREMTEGLLDFLAAWLDGEHDGP